MKSYGVATNETSSAILSHGAIDLGAYIVLSFEWMKSYGVTIQMKPLQKYFHMVNYLFSM